MDAKLVEIVLSTPWLLELLRTVRSAGPPGAFVAAGAVRDTVWDVLTGRASSGPHADVDVVYWAAGDAEASARLYEGRLRALRPDVDWEVTNQATVHLWHWREGRLLVTPHPSVDAGIASWTETATAVGVRLAPDDSVAVVAPLGLADLLALRVRHNPGQSGVDVFWKRVSDKRWLERWPELQLVPPSGA
jgi:hypothetical protein